MSSFGIVDYIIFVGTLAVSMFIGVYYAFFKKQTTNEELLVGGRQMAILPAALSLLATYMSAILVLGTAGEIYANGAIVFCMMVGALFFIPFGGFLFLPTLYNLKLTSVYEYLELRFDSKFVRLLATLTFIAQMVLYSGVVLFAPSLALNAVVPEFPIWASIVSVGSVAAIYTSIGGIKAVVWTDVFQVCMMFAGMLAVIIKGAIRVGGMGKVFQIVGDHDRLDVFPEVDPFMRHTVLALFFGQGMFWLSSYGCHQTTVQRYCSMSSLKRAFIALILTSPLVFVTMCLAIFSGLVIFANYAGCDPLSLGLIKRADQISPHFVLEFLSPTSGLLGLFVSCLFSGALSTISSTLNSLTAVTYEDFLKNSKYFRNMSDTFVIKTVGFLYGVLVILMGFLSGNLGGVLTASIVVNGSVSGPLLGVFVLGVLLPFINKKGAIVGMLTGHAVTFWISIGSLLMKRRVPSLPFRIDGCEDDLWLTVNQTAAIMRQNQLSMPLPDLEWPDKIYSISYALYPLVGLLVTIIVAIPVSLVTGPTPLTKKQERFTHSWVVAIYRIWRKAFGSSENIEMDQIKTPSTNKVILNGMEINMTNGVIPVRSDGRLRRSSDTRRRDSFDIPPKSFNSS